MRLRLDVGLWALCGAVLLLASPLEPRQHPIQVILDPQCSENDPKPAQRPLRTLKQVVDRLSLSTNWTVLGPFPGGMRELPFGGFQPSVYGPYGSLLEPNTSALYPSAYSPFNGAAGSGIFTADDELAAAPHPQRAQQHLRVGYPELPWERIRSSAGWASLQWQMVASTDLIIGDVGVDGITASQAVDRLVLAASMDKVSEFAIVPSAAFTKSMPSAPLSWHSGDWYSYIRNSREAGSGSDDSVPASHHLIPLAPGSYKVLIRAQYEIRIFTDPGEAPPEIAVGISLAIASAGPIVLSSTSTLTNVPDVVGGWLAGWGVSFGARNLDPDRWYQVDSISVVGDNDNVWEAKTLKTSRLAPGQTRQVPVRLLQRKPIDGAHVTIDFRLTLKAISPEGEDEASKMPDVVEADISLRLQHRPAFHDGDSSDQARAFVFTYLARDSTVQAAAAVPPLIRRNTEQGGPRPPLLLALHGAGVDARDLGFASNFNRPRESWIIQPTGRTPWGYDWQGASLEAADDAVSSFNESLWGLPPSCEAFAAERPSGCTEEAERDSWAPDVSKLFVVGHSNGGQGAWYRLARFPDRAIGGIVASAYTKVADYVPFSWKVGRHYEDPSLQGILRSSVAMFENDIFASNLAGLDLLVKHGSEDGNVPAWNSRDMVSIVDVWNTASGCRGATRLSEVAGRPHWWDALFKETDVEGAIAAKCTLDANPGYRKPDSPDRFTLTVANPAESGSKGGWSIAAIETPGRLSRLSVEYRQGEVALRPSNAQMLRFDFAALASGPANKSACPTNGTFNFRFGRDQVLSVTLPEAKDARSQIVFEKAATGAWTTSDESLRRPQQRPMGPMIRILASKGPIQIVLPTRVSPEEHNAFLSVARRFATDSLLYGVLDCNIVLDREALNDRSTVGNVIILGGSHQNLLADRVIARWPGKSPVVFKPSGEFSVRDRHFWEPATALLTLGSHPWRPMDAMALILHGTDLAGVERAARLLPVRTVTMLPEWVVVDGTSEWAGEGGVKGAGWWSSDWQWSESMSYLE